MKLSYNWLSKYLSSIPGPEEVARLLTLTGLEVEEAEQKGFDYSGIVAGNVIEVYPHPNADRLVVCKVNIGTDEPAPIVCGAPNVTPGINVPVALPGAKLSLPDGSVLKIKKAKIRGEKSEGMICAEDELGISEDHSGIMILGPSITPGTPFQEVVETFQDTVYEIGLTPNRPDAACHLGAARDISAVTGATLIKPDEGLPRAENQLPDDTIIIKDTDKCHRYIGIHMTGVNVGESPQWLKNLLIAIGLRPVNNVVDITNFILHELGQPLHAFDYQKLSGGSIVVQSFDTEQPFVTLDDVERKAPAGALFICDREKPVALAGIMGGVNTEISNNTTDVLIESAWFEPTQIRKTSRLMALQTDSSYRFERGVDPDITLLAALRCASLISEYCDGKIVGIQDIHPVRPPAREILLRHKRVDDILGVSIPPDTIVSILNRLEISTKEASHNNDITATAHPGAEKTKSYSIENQKPSKQAAVSGAQELSWICSIPAFRPDITAEIDLIEEIARIYGYHKIPDPGPVTIAIPEPLPFRESFRDRVKRACSASGLREIYTNSLLPEQLYELLGGASVVIPALNPITKDQSLLRPTLLYGFLRSAAYNFNRKVSGIRFFETGNIFQKREKGGVWIEGVHEATHLHIGIAGYANREHWKKPERLFDFFDLKSIIFSILKQLGIEDKVRWQMHGEKLLLLSKTALESEANGSINGISALGKIHFPKEKKLPLNSPLLGILFEVNREWKKQTQIEEKVFVAELNVDYLEELSKINHEKAYSPITRFPSFEFDLALAAKKNISVSVLEEKITHITGSQLANIEVFDVFEGGSLPNDEKSVAFRLTFQDNHKTLTIEDVEPMIRKILEDLKDEYGVNLRS